MAKYGMLGEVNQVVTPIEYEQDDKRKYPDNTASEYLALKRLGERLRMEYDRHYGDE